MTQEEKAKAYDEALKRIENLENTTSEEEAVINYIFPQLHESEDERIIRFFAELATNACGGAGQEYYEELGLNYDKVMTWLEKQKEQKPESCDCSRDEESYTNGIHHVLMNPEAYGLIKQKPAEQLGGTFTSYDMAKTFTEGQNYVVAHPEKFGLYKPAEWSEDYNKENIQTRFAFYTYKDDPSTLYLSNVFVEESSRNHGFGTRILKAAEKVAEAIGAITISLKVKQNSPANAWYRKNGYGYVAFEDGYDWLEKNLEYMKPNKQEWSDEDADMLNCCISSIEEAKENRYAYKETDGDTSYDREIDWLKSLRPQPHWKPSEEQMKALEDAFRKDGGNEYRKVINSLYCDLQKLL